MVFRHRATELTAVHGGRLSSEQVQQSEATSNARLRPDSPPGYDPIVGLTNGPSCLFRVPCYIVAARHDQSDAALIERGREIGASTALKGSLVCTRGDCEQAMPRTTRLRQGKRPASAPLLSGFEDAVDLNRHAHWQCVCAQRTARRKLVLSRQRYQKITRTVRYQRMTDERLFGAYVDSQPATSVDFFEPNGPLDAGQDQEHRQAGGTLCFIHGNIVANHADDRFAIFEWSESRDVKLVSVS